MKKYIVLLLLLPLLVCSEPPPGQEQQEELPSLWEEEAQAQEQQSEESEGQVQSEESTLPLTAEGRSPFVKIAKDLMPAIVSISAEQVYEVTRSPFPDFFEDPFDEFWRRFFPELRPRKEEIKRPILGSGFIVSDDGYILTNNHVVTHAKKIIVKTMDEKEYKAELVGTDELTDVALIKIKARNLLYAKLGNSDAIEVGDWVMAIGNPFQLMGTVTVGVVSAKERRDIAIAGGPQIQNFIQTDAAINPGNSGGPLVNIKGAVVGINTAIKTASFYPTGNIGIGFAIPINIAEKVMKDLIEYKEVRRGWLGVSYQRLTSELAETYGLEETKGVLINKVISNSPASKAGVKEEDIILKWDGKEVTYSNFPVLVSQTSTGKKVKVVVFRKNKSHSLWVKVGKRPASVAEVEEVVDTWLGLHVVSLSSREAQSFNVESEYGVLVVEVEYYSPADDVAIQPGDVIKRIGDIEIKDMSDFEKAHSTYKKQKSPILFKLERGDMTIYVGVRSE